MSASFHRAMGRIDPLGHAIVEGVFGIEKAEKKQAASEQAAKSEADTRAAEEAAAAERMKTTQMETRGASLQSAAAAAGATRSGNQSDWLAGGDTGAKPRRNFKRLLGE